MSAGVSRGVGDWRLTAPAAADDDNSVERGAAAASEPDSGSLTRLRCADKVIPPSPSPVAVAEGEGPWLAVKRSPPCGGARGGIIFRLREPQKGRIVGHTWRVAGRRRGAGRNLAWIIRPRPANRKPERICGITSGSAYPSRSTFNPCFSLSVVAPRLLSSQHSGSFRVIVAVSTG